MEEFEKNELERLLRRMITKTLLSADDDDGDMRFSFVSTSSCIIYIYIFIRTEGKK